MFDSQIVTIGFLKEITPLFGLYGQKRGNPEGLSETNFFLKFG